MKEQPEIDIGIVGYAENTFPYVLENLDNLEKIEGLIFRNRSGHIIFTGQARENEVWDDLIYKHKFFDLSSYSWIGIQTKRGCCFRCLYCTYPYLSGRKVIIRKPENVMKEIEDILSRGARKIYICDCVFNYPMSHSLEILERIRQYTRAKKIDLSLRAYLRCDYVNREFIRVAREAGMTFYEYSPDGATDFSLKKLQKDITVEDILSCADVTASFNDTSMVMWFILGIPDQTKKIYVIL